MEFVERYSLYSISLSLSLSFHSTPLHTSPFYSLPRGSFRKARDQEPRDIVSGMTNTHRCVSVSFHARSLGGRHFGRCLFNQVWRTTRSRFPGRLNLPLPPSLLAPRDVVISVSSVGKVCPVQTSAGNLGEEREGGRGCNLADSSGSYNNDPTPTNYFVSR